MSDWLSNSNKNLPLLPIPFMDILNTLPNELNLLKKHRKPINSSFLSDHTGFYGVVPKSTAFFSIITITAFFSIITLTAL